MIVPGALLVFAIGEGAAWFVFRYLKGVFAVAPAEGAPVSSEVKGILERAVLLVGLLGGFPHILIAFSALKLGTRLRDVDGQVTNDYFLVGNLASVLIAMVDAVIAAAIWGGR